MFNSSGNYSINIGCICHEFLVCCLLLQYQQHIKTRRQYFAHMWYRNVFLMALSKEIICFHHIRAHLHQRGAGPPAGPAAGEERFLKILTNQRSLFLRVPQKNRSVSDFCGRPQQARCRGTADKPIHCGVRRPSARFLRWYKCPSTKGPTCTWLANNHTIYICTEWLWGQATHAWPRDISPHAPILDHMEQAIENSRGVRVPV